MKRTAVTPTIISLDPSFRRHLRAANLSPRTEAVYGYGLADLARFLEAQEMPQEVASISREHLESYFEDLLSRRKPATALAYFKGLQQFWKWAEDEGDVSRSPMSKMRPPRVAQNPPPVLSVEQVRALLEACSGNNFEDRRDAALVRLFCDTGARLAEVVGMKLEDVDLDQGIAVVTGKGSCIRLLPIGGKTIKAIDRYMRARASHPEADAPELWIGRKGRMGPSGVQQMLRRRSREAGIPTVNPHAFRHTFAHRWQADGGNESDLMALTGWKSRQMLSRYGASAATERAIDAHRRLSPGDKLRPGIVSGSDSIVAGIHEGNERFKQAVRESDAAATPSLLGLPPS